MADEDRSFDPQDASSQAQVNRGREQGLGMGQRDLDEQRDPAGNAPALEGVGVNPQEDWGEPADEGATYSANHANRGAKTDAQRGPGAKTRRATKDAISRRT
ncbi:MAG TPA: hypothetical protein VIE16_07735 [Phenylobacterium sp.]|jgi:hypothetical protein